MRNNWNEVYTNQKVVLQTLAVIDEIFLAGDRKIHHAMKEAIIQFQNDFVTTLLLAPKALDFSYESYLKTKMQENTREKAEDYLTFFEENAFVEKEIKLNLQF